MPTIIDWFRLNRTPLRRGLFFQDIFFIFTVRMYYWLPYPFIRILLFFIIGIITGVNLQYNPLPAELITLLFTLLLIFILSTRIRLLRNYGLAGIIGCLLFVLLGFINTRQTLPSEAPDDIGFFKATIISYPEEKDNYFKYEAKVSLGSEDGKTWQKMGDKILLYLGKEKPVEYGDEVFVKSPLYEIQGLRNPGEFNYRKYLLYKGINAQAFVSANDFLKIGEGNGWAVIGMAFKIRAWVDNSVDNYFDQKHGAILKALLVGIRSDMDDNLNKAYAAAGAIHVLAVSGLHVGIFYGMFLWAFGWIKYRPHGKIIFAIAALLFLWFYAFVTGFSPSILRAVLMFSFIIVAQATNRGSGIYNAIAGSAFLLLCFNPLLLFSVGFQLSYLAVIGIVYLYPRLVGLWEFKNLYLDRVWQMSIVGVAAQITTFPLSLYYFHQFPSYFILSNLIVIPAATLILSSGLVFLAVQWSSLLASLAATLISWIISFMNGTVLLIESLPSSTINEVFLSPFQLGLTFIGVVLLIMTFVKKNIRLAWMFMFISCWIVTVKIVEEYHLNNEKHVQFYSINYTTAIDFIEGKNIYTYARGEENSYEFFVEAERGRRHAVMNPFPELLKYNLEGNEILHWKGKKMLILTEIPAHRQSLQEIDYLIIENNSLRNWDWLLEFGGERIILGTTNSINYRNSFLQFSRENKLEVYDLNRKALAIQF